MPTPKIGRARIPAAPQAEASSNESAPSTTAIPAMDTGETTLRERSWGSIIFAEPTTNSSSLSMDLAETPSGYVGHSSRTITPEQLQSLPPKVQKVLATLSSGRGDTPSQVIDTICVWMVENDMPAQYLPLTEALVFYVDNYFLDV